MKKTQNFIFKKALVMLMAVMMVFTMMPSMAWAEDEGLSADKHNWVSNFEIENKNKYKDTDVRSLMKFDPDTHEYNVDFAAGAYPMAYLTATQEAVDAGVYYQVMLDGKAQEGDSYKPQQIISTERTRIAFTVNNISWTAKKLTLLVGKLEEGEENLSADKCVAYNVNMRLVPALQNLQLMSEDAENQYTLTPAFHYQDTSYSAEVPSLTVKLGAKHTADTTVTLPQGEKDEGTRTQSWFIIDLSKYITTGSRTASVPLKVSYADSTNNTTYERTITLTLTVKSQEEVNTPIIKSWESNRISCKKGEIKTITVATEPIENAALTYQWYWARGNGIPQFNEYNKIEDATSASYTPPTDTAEKYLWYCCKVTNKTADGQTYSAVSDFVNFVVTLSYVNNPEISKQPGECTLGGFNNTEILDGTFKTEYNAGEQCNPIFIGAKDGEIGTVRTYTWFYNSSNTTIGGAELASTFYRGSGEVSGFYLNKAFDEGAYYIYCVVRDTDETNPNNYAETVSETCKVVFKPIDAKDFEGSGTEADPFLLKTQQDLLKLQERVNTDGISYAGNFFKVANDITLPMNWTPIGCTKDGTHDIKNGLNLNAFSGTIDGKISEKENAVITVPAGGLPLLGYVRGATVKNLNIKGERIEGAGLVNNYAGVGLEGNAVTIENVCLKSGSQTLKSGLITSTGSTNPYAVASAKFTVTIKDCVIEKGVTIGYKGTERQIGSFADRINGTIENCESYATVKGKDYVGGILGTKDNAMGSCTVKNSKFHGSVEASGSYAGGIVGGGYCNNDSAPNGVRPTIAACTVDGTVKGKECVGGILGGDQYTAQAWDAYSIIANSFKGKISGEKYVGGIVGYYNSLNKYDNIAGNFYTNSSGAKTGIGFVKYIDTNYGKVTIPEGTTVFNTENGTAGCPEVYISSENPPRKITWKATHNRTDDPLGADKEKLARAVDSIPDTAFCYELIMNGTPKKEYYIGDEIDFKDVTFTAKWTGGKADTHPTVGTGENNVKVTGYNKNSHSVQTVTLSYGYAQTTFQVAVKRTESTNPAENKLTVKFTLLGDSIHEEANQKGGPHGLALNKLDTWLDTKEYEVSLNATVWDLMQKVQKQNSDVEFLARGSRYGTYVYGVSYKGTKLEEFDNGNFSGWMYTVNGTHPEVGVASRFLNNGDAVVFHYTDDYTKEEGSEV